MKITQEEAMHLFDYDPETGVLTNKVRRGPNGHPGSEAGHVVRTPGGNYRNVGIGKTKVGAHRIIWLYMAGEAPEEIDHIDGNGLNNKWENLRSVSRQENAKNKRLYRRNKSGVPGVFFDKKSPKWVALIKTSGKTVYLGRHETIIDAVAARMAAEKKYNYHANHGAPRVE